MTNQGKEPLPSRTLAYTVGVVKTNQESKTKSFEDMHEAELNLAYKYGFSEITSVEVTAAYKYQHKETTTKSEMTSTTTSETLTLQIPEVGPGSTWCAYRLKSMAWQFSRHSEINFMFNDIIVTDHKLEGLMRSELIIHGRKQKWDEPKGYLLWTRKWGGGDTGWFLYMQNNGEGNVRAWHGDPGAQGHILFTKRDGGDANYLLSTKKWPNTYMYMQDKSDGNVRGWSGDPGDQGHFVIKAHPYKACYLVSTVKWPGWYMYMQNTDDGNVRGWEGDPGDQGCWIMHNAWTDMSLNTTSPVFYS